MPDPRDAIRTLRAVPSVPTRLERVEDAVRSLAADKDQHAALIDHLLTAVDDRVARLESRVDDAEDAERRRRALAAADGEAEAIHVLVLGDEGVATPADLPEAAAAARRDGAHVVLVRAAADLLGVAWPAAGVAALAARPDAIAAYGERIDVLGDGADAADATLVSRFEPEPDAIGGPGTPAVELSGVVVRASALAGLAVESCRTPLEVLRALHACGPLVAVATTATVGALRDPAS